MEPNVSASQSEAKPDPFADLVRELHAIASDLTDLIGSGLPAPSYFALDIHPGGRDRDRDDDRTAQAVDALGLALIGKPGASHKMLDGTYHYGTGEHRRGPIEVHVYDSVDTAWAEGRHAAAELAAKEAELEKLRTEVAELRAAADTGLDYGREDLVADDPTPVSPARVPLHEGAIVDGNQLVDETPKFALDAEVWVLLPSGPVPGVVVGLNGGEDYAVKTPDGRDLFGVKPSEMRPMEAWETAVVSDRLAEAIEPVADSGPEGLCWVRVPTLAGPDRPCSQPIERDPLSPSGFVHIEGGWRGHAAKPLVSDETIVQAAAMEQR